MSVIVLWYHKDIKGHNQYEMKEYARHAESVQTLPPTNL
jgi:hypothetical protein